jgi:hypothetical protein
MQSLNGERGIIDSDGGSVLRADLSVSDSFSTEFSKGKASLHK